MLRFHILGGGGGDKGITTTTTLIDACTEDRRVCALSQRGEEKIVELLVNLKIANKIRRSSTLNVQSKN